MWSDAAGRIHTGSNGCILRRDGYLRLLLVNSIFMSFPVCRIDGVDSSGHVTTVTYCLSPDSVTIARGYDAMREDPNIYKTLDFCGYSASRHFPDMQLPVPGAPSVSDSAQQPTQRQFVPEHDEHVRFLKPLGRDPCSYFKEKDEARILRALGPDVVVCPFCSRKCRSHQKLVSHCKRRHCQSLALKCTSCNKVFGDSYALKIHMRLHSSSDIVNKCNICGKAYLTKSKLNEHSKVHTIGRVPCEHATSYLPNPRHCLCTRRHAQNVLELIISLKRKGNHISVLTAPRDTSVYLMQSATASLSIPVYNCGRMRRDGCILRRDGCIRRRHSCILWWDSCILCTLALVFFCPSLIIVLYFITIVIVPLYCMYVL